MRSQEPLGNFIIYANFSLSSFLNGSSFSRKQAFVGEEKYIARRAKRMSAWEAMIDEVQSSVVCEGKMQIGLQVVFVSLKPTEVSETETEMHTTNLNPFSLCGVTPYQPCTLTIIHLYVY